MATVILTIKDTGPDSIELRVSGPEGEPEPDSLDELTKAHRAAAAMIAAISSVAKTTTIKAEGEPGQ